MDTASTKFTSEYVTIHRPLCMDCEYRDKDMPTLCLAYPKGIPKEILVNEVDHTKPYQGDHGIQFKKKAAR